MSTKMSFKKQFVTGSEIREMSERIDALMSSVIKGDHKAINSEKNAIVIGALAEMIRTSACALGTLSETISPHARMNILTEMQKMLYELSEITIQRAKEIAAENGFEFDVFDPREHDQYSHLH